MNKIIALIFWLLCLPAYSEGYEFSIFTLSEIKGATVSPSTLGIIVETGEGEFIALSAFRPPEGVDARTALKEPDKNTYKAGMFVVTEGKHSFDLREGWYENRSLAYCKDAIVLVEYKSRDEITDNFKNTISRILTSVVLSSP